VLNERIFATEGLIEKLSAQDQKVRWLAGLSTQSAVSGQLLKGCPFNSR